MTDLIAPPPWKQTGVNGYEYKNTVAEGYFLETLSLIACRLADLNETMKDVIEGLANIE